MYTITQSRLLYVLSIDDRQHKGLLKIGEVFVDNSIADSANEKLKQDTVRDILSRRSYMEGVSYELIFVESTTYDQATKCYKADDIYRKLLEMGVASKSLARIDKEDADIWFACSLLEIQHAINEVKNGKLAGFGKIKFRPEQKKAIKATVEHFKKEKGKSFLWNAKMRFGKTLSGLQVAKEMGYKSTLIITHRPVVDAGWKEDFEKIFRNEEDLTKYRAAGIEPIYGRRMLDEKDSQGDFYTLTKGVDEGKNILVFFVSMQYLRLSKFAKGKEKNFDPLKKAIMEYDWDFVMVDEAHEGIEAAAGLRVMDKLKKEKTRILSLSGTPFNLLEKYEEGEIYTWDYVMEQQSKLEWDDKHFGDPNPYADLPRMKILTFKLDDMIRRKVNENNEAFKFHEFFRVWTKDDVELLESQLQSEQDPNTREQIKKQIKEVRVNCFVYEDSVKLFLNKLVEQSSVSKYPFSTKEFRDNFRHTFWLLPGVKEAKALEVLLKEHPIFGTKCGKFHIINAAGDGNIEDKDGSALADVLNNIRGNKELNIKEKPYTITLSCGKLTTGVSVKEWTAVLCMKGSENTPAANYMQTIFRVQTSAILNGRQKSDCYVFDFAPDRALTAVAETAKMAVYARTEKGKKQLKQTQEEEKKHLSSFIKLCQVLTMDEGKMGEEISASEIFKKLNNVYIERAVRSGYADNSLYDPERLLHLTPEQEKALGDVHDLLGSLPNKFKPEKISINNQGLSLGKGEEDVQYAYYLSSSSNKPERPTKTGNISDEGTIEMSGEGWSYKMNMVTALFRYLFVSKIVKINGVWGDFAEPVLYKEWVETSAETDAAKAAKDKENQEKRARMSVLRGVSIRIPLLVYGAEINDEKESITIDNFTKIVDDLSWEEYMPKGFKKETFEILKDCFDSTIFTGAAERIRAMVKEADYLNTEDRIAKIATIFSYFHNPDKETVLTPWPVVNMHISSTLGGWCFYEEDFKTPYVEENRYGIPTHTARRISDNPYSHEIFENYNSRILEINSKTGLYPLYMAYSMFRSIKEPAFRKECLTETRGVSRNWEEYENQAKDDIGIWEDVLQDNIFVVCRTRMAASITRRTLAGFRKDISMNVTCYEKSIPTDDLIRKRVYSADAISKLREIDANKDENEKVLFIKDGVEYKKCEMIEVLKYDPSIFTSDVVKGKDFWHVYNAIPYDKETEDINDMKFTAVVGNPPYQGVNHQQIYPYFYTNAIKLGKHVSLIFPVGWQEPKNKNNLSLLNNTEIKADCQIVRIDNRQNVFPGIAGVEWVNIIHWLKDYDNGLDGAQLIYTNGENPQVKELSIEAVKKPDEIIELAKIVTSKPNFESVQGITSRRKPYGLATDVFSEHDKYGLPAMQEDRNQDNDLTIFGKGDTRMFVPYDYPLPKRTRCLNEYKVFIPYAWGNMSESSGLGGAFADIRVGLPNELVNETYLEAGPFDSFEEAYKYAKFLMTKFARALLYMNKTSQHSTTSWGAIPKQDFRETWWDSTVEELEHYLFTKYDLPIHVRSFILNNFQTKTTENIVFTKA